MTTDNSKPNIYPEYCHELSPSIKKWCPLQAVDVHGLAEHGMFNNGRRLYHHGNHPIKWVRLTGVIVAVDEFASRRIFTLDDSSGACIECVSPAPPTIIDQALASTKPNTAVVITKNTKEPAGPSVTNPTIPWDDMDVGAVVKIKGGITTFRDQKQVEIIKVEVLRSTDQEVRCWNEVVGFRREVLGIEWVVSTEQEEKCRRRALKEVSRKTNTGLRRAGGVLDKRLERIKVLDGKVGKKEHRQSERSKEDEKARKKRKERRKEREHGVPIRKEGDGARNTRKERERHEQHSKHQKTTLAAS